MNSFYGVVVAFHSRVFMKAWISQGFNAFPYQTFKENPWNPSRKLKLEFHWVPWRLSKLFLDPLFKLRCSNATNLRKCLQNVEARALTWRTSHSFGGSLWMAIWYFWYTEKDCLKESRNSLLSDLTSLICRKKENCSKWKNKQKTYLLTDWCVYPFKVPLIN